MSEHPISKNALSYEASIQDLIDMVETASLPNGVDFGAVFGTKARLKEFRTVGIRGPRQSGKTRAILEMAKSEDMVIVHDDIYISTVKTMQKDFVESKQRPTIVSVDTAVKSPEDKTEGVLYCFPRIWIDDASILAENQMEAINLWICQTHQNNLPIVILVG